MYKGSLEEKTALKDYFELIYLVNTREKVDYFDKKAQAAYWKASKVLNGQSQEYLDALDAAKYLNSIKILGSIRATYPNMNQLEAIKQANIADGLVKKVFSELRELFPVDSFTDGKH